MNFKITVLLLISSMSCYAKWAEVTLNKLTLEQKIGQLFFVGVDNSEFAVMNKMPDDIQNRIIATNKREKFNKQLAQQLITKYNVGGIHLIGYGSLKSCFDAIEYFQSITQIPLLVSQDFEWGLTMRLHDAIRFPRNMTLGAIKNDYLIHLMAKEIGRQCALLGVHINFAPVIDINNNPSNPIIGDRSFGSDKERVTQKGFQFMKGLQDAKIIACAKHFCGHGDTSVDSHVNLPVINHSISRINDIEVYPFKHLINNGVKAIMSAHIHIPAIDSKNNVSLTLSKNGMTNLLQNELGFKGLIITDALDMEGVMKYFTPEQAALEAFKAGNDILLMSTDVPKAIEAIKNAIQKDKSLLNELNNKVLKILQTKEALGLYKKKINTDFNNKEFNTIYAKAIKRKLYEEAITIVGSEPTIYSNSIAVIQINNHNIIYTNNKTAFCNELKVDYPSLDGFIINLNASQQEYAELLKKIEKYQTVIVGLFDINRFKHQNYGVPSNLLDFFNNIKAQKILSLFGSPYSLELFNNFESVVMAYEDDEDAQEAAAKVISGRLQAVGKLPI